MHKIVRTLIEGVKKCGGKDGKYACRVEIFCTHPGPNGEMDVEMRYEGDPVLAAYLVENAQNYVEDFAEG